MTPEERKAIAMRQAGTGPHGLPNACERLYPNCCAYHEGFDDALALLVSNGIPGHCIVKATP